MVIDTSALLAIIQKEPEDEAFTRAIIHDSRRLISVVSALEAEMVAFGRAGEDGLSCSNSFFINCSAKQLLARSINSLPRVGRFGDSGKAVIPPV